MKIIICLFMLISSLYCPQWLIFGQRDSDRIFNFIKQYQPLNAQRITAVYLDVSYRYQVPIDYLVRQGWSETRFNRMRIGDSGQSYGIHQIKSKYWNHVLYKIRDEYVVKEIAAHQKLKQPIHHEQLFQYIGGGIESAGYILSNYYARYGNWETTFIAYGCGMNHESTRITATNKRYAYRYKYVRQIMLNEN